MLTSCYTDLATAVQFPRAAQTDQRLGRGQHLGVLIPILMIYFVLAFYRIGHQSFWVDEVRSLESASIDGSFFSPSIWYRGQGPLYFAFLHVWGKLSTNEAVVRALSALFGGVAVCLIYLLGVKLFNRRVAQIGAIIFASSPFVIWYSQEVRYITLTVAATLLSMHSFCQALSSRSFKWWLSYAVVTTFVVLTFLSAVFLPLAQGLYLLRSKTHRPALKKWIAWQAGVFIIFMSWFAITHGHLRVSETTEGVRIAVNPQPIKTGTPRELSAAALPYTLFAFSTGFSMGPSVRELHMSRSLTDLLAHLPALLPLTLLFGTLAILGSLRLWHDPERRDLLLLWLAVPITGVFLVAATTDIAYNVRYACTALPAYIFTLAVAIAAFKKKAVQITLLSAVLFANFVSLSNYYFDSQYAREDSRAAARYLESVARDQDIIVVVGSTGGLRYYYKGQIPIVPSMTTVSFPETVVADRVRELSKKHNRLWLVEIRPWETDPKQKYKAAMESVARSGERKTFPGVEINSYQLSELRP